MESEILYQEENPRLEELLKCINRPGDFCTYGRVAKPMPRLEVEEIGVLSFPVPKTQIEELIKLADRAPYGKGTQTLVDVSVRNCWEIDVNRISLGGRSWGKTIRHLSSLAADGLGCPLGRLNAELYKLLIYETGGFFIPHRDTEKADGMIATLTISLPAAGTGGELLVRHKDTEITIQMNVDDPSELAYAAFYADCQHEIKRVSSGYRIALVYNLCIQPNDTETPQEAPDYTTEIDAIATELVNWCNNDNSSNKLIWILEHEYSQAGLSFAALKNGDRAIAGALCAAAEQAECELYASIVHINESLSAWYAGSGHYYGSDDPLDYEIDELIEDQFWMDSWASPDGRNPNFEKISIDEYELMPAGVLDDAVPDEEDVDEATGNAGATVDRAYHFAALVLMKRTRMLDVLVKQSSVAAVTWVAEELERNDERVDDRIIGLAEKLVDVWPKSPYYFRSNGNSAMLRLLSALNDQRISMRFLREIAIRDYRGAENDEFTTVLSALDPVDAQEILCALIRNKFTQFPEKLLQLLMLLDRKISLSDNRRKHLFKKCSAEIFQMLPNALSSKMEKTDYFYERKRPTLGKEALKNLFVLFGRADAMDTAQFVPEVLEKYPKVVLLDRSVPKALVELSEIDDVFNSEAYASLWYVSTNYLLQRSDTPPEQPKDWQISANTSCNCQHCRNLRKFCENPEQQIARFPLRKDLRAHLHRIIDDHQLDLFHETERKGSPYILVCTKNRASYERRLKEYAKDIDKMKLLIEITPSSNKSNGGDEELTKLRDAVAQFR